MISLKNPHQIAKMRDAGKILREVEDEVRLAIKPGVTTAELDVLAERLIRKNRAIPSSLHYEGYPCSICASINDEVVHGIPSDRRVLKDGDIISVDCGTLLNGYNGDSCYTFQVGEVAEDVRQLLRTTKESLYKGIEQAVAGHRIGDIGYAVQSHCEAQGYGVVREFVGHGIGREMHEDPQVPNYGRRGQGKQIKNGLCIAIEPMITMGTHEVYMADDKWTIYTRDHRPAAHFEHTMAIHHGKADILSSFEEIEKLEAQRNQTL